VPLFLPDKFIEQKSPQAMYDEAGLNAPQIVQSVMEQLGQKPVLVKNRV